MTSLGETIVEYVKTEKRSKPRKESSERVLSQQSPYDTTADFTSATKVSRISNYNYSQTTKNKERDFSIDLPHGGPTPLSGTLPLLGTHPGLPSLKPSLTGQPFPLHPPTRPLGHLPGQESIFDSIIQEQAKSATTSAIMKDDDDVLIQVEKKKKKNNKKKVILDDIDQQIAMEIDPSSNSPLTPLPINTADEKEEWVPVEHKRHVKNGKVLLSNAEQNQIGTILPNQPPDEWIPVEHRQGKFLRMWNSNGKDQTLANQPPDEWIPVEHRQGKFLRMWNSNGKDQTLANQPPDEWIPVEHRQGKFLRMWNSNGKDQTVANQPPDEWIPVEHRRTRFRRMWNSFGKYLLGMILLFLVVFVAVYTALLLGNNPGKEGNKNTSITIPENTAISLQNNTLSPSAIFGMFVVLK